MCHISLKALKAWYGCIMGEIYLENVNFIERCGFVSCCLFVFLCSLKFWKSLFFFVETECGVKEALASVMDVLDDFRQTSGRE